jgi:hypothetical protein
MNPPYPDLSDHKCHLYNIENTPTLIIDAKLQDPQVTCALILHNIRQLDLHIPKAAKLGRKALVKAYLAAVNAKTHTPD